MIKINDFEKIGFDITWKLIDIGFKTHTIFFNELLPEDILEYAISIISGKDVNSEVIDLACEYKENIDKISQYIKTLANKEKSYYDIEFRKWRVLYISKQLTSYNIDYIKGLIELGDIWAKFDFPLDSPHIFQGRENLITPEEYYTEENYKKLFDKHIEWMEEEIELIKNINKKEQPIIDMDTMENTQT